MTDDKLFRRADGSWSVNPESIGPAARFERELRAEGVDALLIPGLLGAAFMAALTNLPSHQRLEVIHAHIIALREIYNDLLAARQAPGGPMPGL
jgi:hypothetical protein